VGTAVGVEDEPPQALKRLRQSKADVRYRIGFATLIRTDRPEGRVQEMERGLWGLEAPITSVQSC
jgi:hypothetical protein